MKRNLRSLKVCVLCTSALLTSCTLYQKPEVPEMHHPDSFKDVMITPYDNTNDLWWENFHNEQLNDVVEHAIINNYSYQAALKNIEIAQTYISQNMTGLYPQMTGQMENSRNKEIISVGSAISAAPDVSGTSSATNIFNLQILSATLNYEIDVWNQVHNLVDQSKADTQTAIGNTNVIRLTLISAVVNTYFQLMTTNENQKNLEKQYKDAREILELTQVQYEGGLVDDGAVFTAQNQMETILTQLLAVKKQAKVYEYTLAYLMGEYPEEMSVEPEGRIADIPVDKLIPEGIPAYVISHRPDIQAAYTSILSFGFIMKQNIANFLPSFSLTSTFGYASSSFARLMSYSNVIWNYGLSTLQTVLDYPALLSQYERSKVQYDQAILLYKDTIMNAYKEVDSALISYQEDTRSMKAFKIQVHNTKELLSIADAHYRSGLTDYIDYLTNDLTNLQTQYNLTNQTLLVTQDVVQAYKAMGLGIDLPQDKD